MSQKKVMSVLWQEWQVWGIITETWKVCVSTFGHLRRIDPHCAAAGLMSTVSPASNEERAIATVFHQPSSPSLQHPIMPWTHSVSNQNSAWYLVTDQCKGLLKESGDVFIACSLWLEVVFRTDSVFTCTSHAVAEIMWWRVCARLWEINQSAFKSLWNNISSLSCVPSLLSSWQDMFVDYIY